MHIRFRTAVVAAALVLLFAGCGDDDNNTNNVNENDNTPAVCGNGTVEAGEECDEGADNSDTAPGACRSNCRSPFCGDGVVDTNEECDEGAANSDRVAGACRTNCTPARCGDGVVDPSSDPDLDEECDDGPDNSDTAPGACRTDCHLPACGDGVVDPGQHCYVFGAQIPEEAVGFPEDFDGNALLDFLTHDDGLGTVYTQDSTGVFTRHGGRIWLERGLNFMVGDFDGDGDGDLVTGRMFAENRGGADAVPVLQSPWVERTNTENGGSYNHPDQVLLLQNETHADQRLALLPSSSDIWLAEVSPEGYITKWPDHPASNVWGDLLSAQALPDVTGEGWPEVLLCYSDSSTPCQLLHVIVSGGEPVLTQVVLPRAVFFATPARLFAGDTAGIIGISDPMGMGITLTDVYVAYRGGSWQDTTQTGVDEYADLSMPTSGEFAYQLFFTSSANTLQPELYIFRRDWSQPTATSTIERWVYSGNAYTKSGEAQLDESIQLVYKLLPAFVAASTPPDLIAQATDDQGHESLIRLRWQSTQYVVETYPYPDQTYYAMTAGDFTGDGADDVLVTITQQSGSDDPAELLLYPSAALDASPVLLDLAEPVTYVGTGDWDGDGHPDVAALTGGEVWVAVLLQRGNTLRSHKLLRDAQGDLLPKVSAQVVADVTGDGVDDAVVASGDKVWVFSDLVNGEFQTIITSPPALGPVANFIAVDVDDDGDLDLVGHTALFTDSDYEPTSELQILYNSDSSPGTFDTFETFETPYVPFMVSGGDLNGDGLNDLVTIHGLVSVITVHLNTGHANPRFETTGVQLSGGSASDVELVDLDNDGNLDALVATPFEGTGPVLLWGNGDGTFDNPLDLPYVGGELFARTYDMDGDGDLDLSVSRYLTGLDTFFSMILTNEP